MVTGTNSFQQWLAALVNSVGAKRILVAALQTIAAFAQQVPALGFVANLLTHIAGWLGGVSVMHAAISGTVEQFPLGSITSVISFVVVVANASGVAFPVILPYLPIVNEIAKYFGLATVGAALAQVKMNRELKRSDSLNAAVL